jgi:YfiR/HmsC-like
LKALSALTGLLALLGATIASALESSSSAVEDRVRAEFLVRFSEFTEWPPRVFASPASPFVLCLLGTASQVESVESLTTRRVKGRPVSMRRISGALNFEGCHQLFVFNKSGYELPDIVAQAENAPILIVADTPGAAREGAHINFYLEGGYLRFEVNLAAARKAGLTLSSKMLRLARLVN